MKKASKDILLDSILDLFNDEEFKNDFIQNMNITTAVHSPTSCALPRIHHRTAKTAGPCTIDHPVPAASPYHLPPSPHYL